MVYSKVKDYGNLVRFFTYLQHDRKLFWWTPLVRAVRQPHLEGSELLGKERAVLEGLLLIEDSGQLRETQVQSQIPGLPHVVLICWR